MKASAVPGVRAKQKAPASESRLALAEALLTQRELHGCVETVLAWLERTAGVEHAFCAVLEPAHNRLQGVAGRGVPADTVEKFRVYLEDTTHPLAAALGADAPVYISRGLRRPVTPLGDGSLVLVPLRSASGGARGLLFLRSRALRLPGEVEWAARLLAERLLDFIPASRTAAALSAAERAVRGAPVMDDASAAAKTHFLANMSHELRTPLNAILGYTSMLLEGVSGELNPGQKRNVERVDANARSLLGLINNVLDITRLDAGRLPITVETFRLADLVREVLDELEPLILRSKLTVSSRLPSRLPRLTTDRQKLKQILVNLLGNALKFTHEGWVEVSARSDAERRQVAIAVSDSGIGIAPEHQGLLFQDFRQVDDSPTRAYGGAGLGLSISRRLATLLGGAIALESELGRGSTFTLTIPERLKRERR